MVKRKKVGVALGGGGSMGLAHIGVLKVLEREGIPIDYISGTSMGALIGGMYSAVNNLKKVEGIFTEKKVWNKGIFDYIFPKHGLIKGKKIEKLIKSELKKMDFKQLKIPLYITSFDLKNKQEIIFNEGDVSKAIRASISIPGIFVPVVNKGRVLVDGGLVDPIPSEILKKKGADIVIAINVVNRKMKAPKLEEAVTIKEKKKTPRMWETASDAFKIMAHEIYKYDLKDKGIDFIINVNTKNKDMFKFSKKQNKEEIKEGEKAAKKSLDEIKKATKSNLFKQFLESLEEYNEEIKNKSSEPLPKANSSS